MEDRVITDYQRAILRWVSARPGNCDRMPGNLKRGLGVLVRRRMLEQTRHGPALRYRLTTQGRAALEGAP